MLNPDETTQRLIDWAGPAAGHRPGPAAGEKEVVESGPSIIKTNRS